MLNNQEWEQISTCIGQATKQHFAIVKINPLAGGCISSAYNLQGKNSSYFIKLNQPELLPMFEAEFAGLKEIMQTGTIKVPKPIVCGVSGNKSFLVLEMLALTHGNIRSDQQLGLQLAALHKIPQAFFGWHQNNTIGSTEQSNPATQDWIEFWHYHRLGFQLGLAEKNGYTGKFLNLGEKLAQSLGCFFSGYQPQPALLHGDLWAGNFGVTEQGEPVIYDPACYYGDAETDIAMTELFSGFGANFYASYNEYRPLHPDYRLRKTLYNIYHILNHLNLFGGGYQYQAQNMIESLLSEIN